MPKWPWQRSSATNSGSTSITLSDDGKKKLLITQVQQITAQIYLEGVKREMVRKKALTDRHESKRYAVLDNELRGRINAMTAEREHLVETLAELDPAYANREDEE